MNEFALLKEINSLENLLQEKKKEYDKIYGKKKLVTKEDILNEYKQVYEKGLITPKDMSSQDIWRLFRSFYYSINNIGKTYYVE